MRLLRRFKPLDQEAFQAFYREHAQRLVVFFARRTLDPETALDLMAETFAQAYLSRGSFRGTTDAAAEAWIFGIARNLLASYWRTGAAERRALTRLAMQPPTPSTDDLERIDELAGTADIRQAASNGMQSLGAAEREAVVLRVVNELPYDEVAARLGVSEQAARARVSRGLRTLADTVGTDQAREATA
jgi:RNA polymerase sigma factor (sigma-70 family)